MAKRAAAAEAIEGYSKEPHGAGWKRCPQCGGYVKGPLSKTCPACKHTFAFKSKLVRKVGAAASADGLETDNKLMAFALKVGGIDKATDAIKKLKNDPAIALAIELGGIEKAEQAMEALGSRIKNG